MKRKYTSIYGAKNLLTAAQYLAELIIEKRSKKQNEKLPSRFWTLPEYKKWKLILQSENIHACELLKKYDEDCVINGFNCYECDVILTLKNKKLDMASQRFQKEKDKVEKVKEIVELNTTTIDVLPRKNKVFAKNRLSRLR